MHALFVRLARLVAATNPVTVARAALGSVVVGAVVAAPAPRPATALPVPGAVATVLPASLPTAFGGFAGGADVVVRVACGPDLGVVPADHVGVAVVPARLLDRVPAGRHRLLVTGAGPAGAVPASGTVAVTVPNTHVVGVEADGHGAVRADPTVPVPAC